MKLIEWFQHQEDPHVERWFELTQEKFASFIASSSKSPSIGNSAYPSLPSNVLEPLATQEVHSISSPPIASPAVNNNSLAMEFLKGIKRTVADYSDLKEDKYWLAWHRGLLATAATHGISNVFDSTYTPSTPEETALFHGQNTFAYSVFEKTLKTARS